MSELVKRAAAARKQRLKNKYRPRTGFKLDWYGEETTFVLYGLKLKEVKQIRRDSSAVLDKYKINQKPSVTKTDKNGHIIQEESFNSHKESTEASIEIAEINRGMMAKCVYIRIWKSQLEADLRELGEAIPPDLPSYEDTPAFLDEEGKIDEDAIDANLESYNLLLPEVMLFNGFTKRSKSEQDEIDKDPKAPTPLKLNG